MAYYKNNYMYETSPRKLKPEYSPPKKRVKKVKKVENDEVKQNKNKPKTENRIRKNKLKCIFGLLVMFSVLFAVSYRNAQISENYTILKNQEKELSTIQKENGLLNTYLRAVPQCGSLHHVHCTDLRMVGLPCAVHDFLQ